MKTVTTAPRLRRAKCAMPIVILGACLWILRDHLDAGVWVQLDHSLAALSLRQWVLAGLFSGLSFWAVARYDGLAHRHFQTGSTPQEARRSGFAAIAIGQTVGFGVLSGAAVRWRMLPDLGAGAALRLSLFVSVSFMLALGFLTALMVLALPTPSGLFLPAIAVAIGVPALALVINFAPACAPLRHRNLLPGLPLMLSILGWASVDLICAAIAFHILLPGGGVEFATFLPAFLLGLSCAMLCGTPGGVGPFEVTLIALLPQVPPAELIAGILLFRMIYYAVPALLGAAFALTPPRTTIRPALRHRRASTQSPPAESGILSQNNGQIRTTALSAYAIWPTSQTATMLFDPIEGRVADALADLRQQARTTGKLPCLYKCHARTAALVRAGGWQVVRIAQDHVLNLAAYDLTVPARASLRRKCRKASRAGVFVERANHLPIPELAAIDTAWQALYGTAQGGTMGRFCPAYLSGQEVFVAYREGKPIAFVSFHSDAQSLCLDLMRHGAELPDGTMHLLVQTAIETARADGKGHLSLAATPNPPTWARQIPPLLARWDRPGLRQFKACFAPRTLPLYAAAPNGVALALALADIALEVHQPRPLPRCHTTLLHKQHEDYAVELNLRP